MNINHNSNEYDDDEGFSSNLNISSDKIQAFETSTEDVSFNLYKRMIASSNLNDRNALNNSSNNYTDSFESYNGINNAFQNSHLTYDQKPRHQSLLSNSNHLQNYDEDDDDEVFSGNLNISSDKVQAPETSAEDLSLNLYKKLLASSNYTDRNILNNNLNNYTDNFEGHNGVNNAFQNSHLTSDPKIRHQSLLTNSKPSQNFTSMVPNLTSFQNLNDLNTKKRTTSFGSSMPSFSAYQFGQPNNLTNSISHKPSPQQMRFYSTNSNSANQTCNNITQNNFQSFSNDLSMPNCLSSIQAELAANNKPLRSERLPSQFIDDIIKQAKMRRKSGGKKEVCVFCRNNGEKEQFYTSHTLKDATNRVSCPILRLYQCPICHASADNAHTIKYCPCAEKDSCSIKLFKDSRMNTAVLLMNSLANNQPLTPLSASNKNFMDIKQKLNLRSNGFPNNSSIPFSNANANNNNNMPLNQNSISLNILNNILKMQ